MISDTLMVSSLDEVSTEYGLIAEAVSHPPDFASTTFRLRAEARYHDGKPITVEDVIFSLEAFKKHSPMMAAYYRHVVKVEKTGEREVTFTFDAPGQPRDAGDRRPAQRAAEALVGGHRRLRQEARHRRDHARAAARQRRLPHQGVRGRPHHRLRAGEGLLGQGSQRQYRARQFRRAAVRVFPRRDGRDRGVQGRPSSTGAPRTAPRTGRPPTTSRPSRTSASSSRNFRCAAAASCRRSCSTPGATSSRIRGCGARSISPTTSRR